MKMGKIWNYRPFGITFLGLALGTLFGGSFLTLNNSAVYVLGGLFVVMVLLIPIILIFEKRLRYSKHYLKMIVLVMLCMILGASLVFGVVGYKASKRNEYLAKLGAESVVASIDGRIDSVEKTDGKTKIVVSGMKVNGENFGCKVKLSSTAQNLTLSVGDNISFEAKIFLSEAYSATLNDNLIVKDIFFYGYITDSVQIHSNNKTILESIQSKTESDLELYAGENYGILKALILGDKSSIDDGTYEIFSSSGIAHILSVSGLHVGFIVALMVFLLNKFKVSSKVQFFSSAIFLLLYCTICGFASSVVRASVMSLCFMLSMLTGEKSDGLSNLGLAGTILILLNPLSVYNIGFQLSFLAVLGIMLLISPLEMLLSKIHLPKVIGSSIAVTISAELATLPVVSSVFGSLPKFSIVINLVLLPLFSIYFSVLFVAFLINIFLPLGVIYVPLSYCFNLFTAVSGFFASLGSIKLKQMNYVIILIYYILLLIISKFTISTNKSKQTACVVAIIMIFASVVFNPTDQNNSLMIFKNYDGTMLYHSASGSYYLILNDVDEYDAYDLKQALYTQNILKINCLILTNTSSDMTKSMEILDTAFDFDVVYFDNNKTTDEVVAITRLADKKLKAQDFDEGFNLEQALTFYGIMNDSIFLGFFILSTTNSLIYINSNFTTDSISLLKRNYFKYGFTDEYNRDTRSVFGKILVQQIASKRTVFNSITTDMKNYYAKYTFGG